MCKSLITNVLNIFGGVKELRYFTPCFMQPNGLGLYSTDCLYIID